MTITLVKNFKKHFPSKTSRIILLLLIIITLATSILFVNSQNSNSISVFRNKFPFLDVARNYIDQKHFIVNVQPLREKLNSYVDAEARAEISIYFEVLNTGANISINQEARFVPGSLIKIPTAIAVMKKIEEGEWRLTNELILYDEDKNPAFGTLFEHPTGTKFTVETLLKEMLINSDDSAHRIFLRNIHNQDFVNILDGLGLNDLFNNDYYITAKEYSRIFRSLYTSSYLNRENSQYLLNLLTETNFDTFVESGLPEYISFAQKIGEHDPEQTYLDSGVVYVPERPYIISVIVKVLEDIETPKLTAQEIMHTISEYTYQYINEYNND